MFPSFGLNPTYVDTIVGAGLVVSGTDQDGDLWRIPVGRRALSGGEPIDRDV